MFFEVIEVLKKYIFVTPPNLFAAPTHSWTIRKHVGFQKDSWKYKYEWNVISKSINSSNHCHDLFFFTFRSCHAADLKQQLLEVR